MIQAARGSAVAVLACILGAAVLAATAMVVGAWNPPGKDEPATFECKAWIYQLWRCEAHHVPPDHYPNLWPQWFAFDEHGQRDYDMGMIGYLRFPIPGSYTIQLRPTRDPSTWVKREYLIP